jgi:hypothetical protein
MPFDARLALALMIPLAGCSLVRTPLFDDPDAGGLDAPLADVPGLDVSTDAPMPDVPGLDAPDLPDTAMPDGGEPDAGCSPLAETCNGLDDDCDDAIDEDTTCRSCITPGSCSDCVRFEAGGRLYQSCPAVTGYRYWGRVCGTLAPGYDLAVPNDGAENDAIAAQLRTVPGLNAYHWIGVNDFVEDGTYITVAGGRIDAAASLAPTGGSHADEGAVLLQAFSGNWEDWPLITSHRALCELGPRPEGCSPPSSDPDQCDHRDDDCDGFVDEDCVGTRSCAARVFWDHVYYVCTDDMTAPEAGDACRELGGGRLAVIDDRFELQFADDFANADAWVGLSQDPAATEPDGWRWLDTPWSSTDPDWSVLWDTAMPSTAADEDCGHIHNGVNRLRDHDCGANRASSLCEAQLDR